MVRVTITLYFVDLADKEFAKNCIDHGFETSWRQKSVTVRVPAIPEFIELVKLELRRIDAEEVRRITVSVYWENQESRENLKKVADVFKLLSGISSRVSGT